MNLFIMERFYGVTRFIVDITKILLNAEKGGEIRRGGMWSVLVYNGSEVWVLVKCV